MVMQIALGSALIVASFVLAALSWLALELTLARLQGWVGRPPWGPRLMAVLGLGLGITLAMITATVWMWALTFWAVEGFLMLETAVYFSLVAVTTLGFGDILLPAQWRLLGGMAAANGMLLFGMMTAMLVETLRVTRLHQRHLRPPVAG